MTTLFLSLQLESVEKTRLSLEQQTEEVRCAVEEKLKTAAAQRDENIKRMLDRLKEHVSISKFIPTEMKNALLSSSVRWFMFRKNKWPAFAKE